MESCKYEQHCSFPKCHRHFMHSAVIPLRYQEKKCNYCQQVSQLKSFQVIYQLLKIPFKSQIRRNSHSMNIIWNSTLELLSQSNLHYQLRGLTWCISQNLQTIWDIIQVVFANRRQNHINTQVCRHHWSSNCESLKISFLKKTFSVENTNYCKST